MCVFYVVQQKKRGERTVRYPREVNETKMKTHIIVDRKNIKIQGAVTWVIK